MYHAIVRHRVAQLFKTVGRGDVEFALAGMAPRFEHIFPGNHALAGVRHTKASMRPWMERLFRLLKDLSFTIKHIAVSGGSWDTTVVVEWRDVATLADGRTHYTNDGAHIIRLRWGKVVSLHAYLDSKIMDAAMRRMVEAGVAEATANRIKD